MNRQVSSVDTYSNESNHEEPHSQDPEEQSNNEGQGADELAVQEAVALKIEVLRERICHTDERQAGERGWSNSNEHGSTVLAVWISDLHKATNVMSVHEDGHRESKTLASETRHNDGVSAS